MKKFKLIPVLAVSMLLAACQAGVKVSKPKFAAEGSAMKLEDFVAEFKTEEGYGPAVKDSEFFQKDPKIGSKEIKGVESESSVTIKTLNGKERSKKEVKSSTEILEQGDSANKIIIGKTKEVGQSKEKTLYGTESSSSSYQQEMTYQEGKGHMADKEYDGVLMLNDTAKEYSLYVPFVDGAPVTSDTWYSTIVCMQASQMVEELFDKLPKTTDEKELAKYSYFKNDKVYTVKYSSADDPKETKETIDDKETVVRTETTKIEAIYQLDVTEGKWAFRSSVEKTLTVEELADYKGYRKGMKTVTETKEYAENRLYDKKVSLKAKDLAKYTEVSSMLY
jgi:hypothetical protein